MSTRIREFRKLRGMTLQLLAQQVGTTAQTIQRLETDNMTVSLDWLERIAGVFGLPAAALLVSDGTPGVAIVGELDAGGDVVPAKKAGAALTLSLVVPAPHPLAVRVAAPFGAFEPGTYLVAGKIEIEPDTSIDPSDCVIGFTGGRMLVRRLSVTEGEIAMQPLEVRGFSDGSTPEIEWIAPVLMAVRYL